MSENMGLSFSYQNYLPKITPGQVELLVRFKEIFLDWNSRINLISRKDTELFEVKHVLHSLSISRFIRFNPGARVLDLGTGGGFPGIPLAILFPEVKFILVDSIEKKMKVVADIVEQLQLKNVAVKRGRVEEMDLEVDYVLSRAVAPMSDLIHWTKDKLIEGQVGSLPNGWVILKGGDLSEELGFYRKMVEIQKISDYWEDEFFETKLIVYLARQIL
jgi:16S rRNA (guanine527-N7)-methyltransferase